MDLIPALTPLAVREVVETALAVARTVSTFAGPQHVNAQRSLAFVDALAAALEARFPRDGVQVFHKRHSASLFDRGGGGQRSEFIFDVLACLVGYVDAPVQQKARPIGFVRAPLFQVESEFDLAEACEDFSKLVCGAAPQSLFVGPLSPRPENYLVTLSEIAPHVKGECFVALVPHPSSWDRSAETPQLHRWQVELAPLSRTG